jgi:peptide deformylase
MRLKILQAGQRVLRHAARPLSPDEIRNASTIQLIKFMRETLRDAPGVGLAAPQVGMGIQLAVIEDRAEYHRDVAEQRLITQERKPVPFHVIVNPAITSRSEDSAEFFEGCLSLAGFMAVTQRSRSVVVDCLNELAEPTRIEAHGWYARILQHEIDHLNGLLYIDRMYTRSFMTAENYNRHWKDVPMEEVSDSLKYR